MFRTRIAFEQDALVLDDERVPFSLLEDASVQDGVLVLELVSGTRRIKLNYADAMSVLDGVLDGIERSHPVVAHHLPAAPEATAQVHVRRLRRRTASVGAPNLMIGRTFSAG